MINITVYDPRAIEPVQIQGTGFRAYEAERVEKLILSLTKDLDRHALLWEIDKYCRRVYSPGFCYMATINSQECNILYCEGSNFEDHLKMWGKDIETFDYIIAKPGTTLYDFTVKTASRLNRKDLTIVSNFEWYPKDYNNSEFLTIAKDYKVSDDKVNIYQKKDIVITTNRGETLKINFTHPFSGVFFENTLYTNRIAPSYPYEVEKETPGITYI